MIKAIDTFYNGNYFRSRLEARWAVFFDELGIKYLYEPEGFKNNKGEMYLPDFYLPDTTIRGYRSGKGCYIEIKHKYFLKNNSFHHGDWFGNLILFEGMPLDNIWGCWDDIKWDGGGIEYMGEPDLSDHPMLFWKCAICGSSKIEFSEGNYNHCGNNKCSGKADVSRLRECANAAAYKRFEHLNNPSRRIKNEDQIIPKLTPDGKLSALESIRNKLGKHL